jgi:DNA-directed RNA polymerase specialized sigma24 family protein
MLTKTEIEKLVYKFLSKCGRRYLNDDLYVGEMISSAHLAMTKYNATIGEPSTLIYRYCRNRFLNLVRQEKEFYSHHTGELTPSMFIKQRNPVDDCIYDEAKNAVANSKLSKRTKEIVLLKMAHPDETLQDLAKRTGVTLQAISLHINSAEQYFLNNKINLD